MMMHNWIKSTLGHGEVMCSRCYITNREAAVLGTLNTCTASQPQKSAAAERELSKDAQPGASS